jgi:hypothetical protein
MTANELADELTKMFRGEEYDRLIHEIPDMLRQQAQEIEDLKNANRFIQNFAQEQHQRVVALEMGFANNGTSDSELAEVRALANRWFLNANRYQWLRNEFANGRETYLAEGIPNGEQLDKYIDEQLKKTSEK